MFQNNPDRVNWSFKWFKVSLQDKRVKLIPGVSQQATEYGSKKREREEQKEKRKFDKTKHLFYI